MNCLLYISSQMREKRATAMIAKNLNQGPVISTIPNSLEQWEVVKLRLCVPNAGGTGSIPGQGTKIPYAAGCGQKKKKRKALHGIRVF